MERLKRGIVRWMLLAGLSVCIGAMLSLVVNRYSIHDVDAKVYYSQFGEDIRIRDVFEYLRITKPTYLDIGAADPISMSNTYMLYQAGSEGVLVDANIDLIPNLKRVRPRDTVLNIGVGIDDVKEADFYCFDEPGINTFDADFAKKWDSKAGGRRKVVRIVKMSLIPINRIMEEHFPNKAPDLLSIDIEGLDIPVLKTLDFEKHRPVVICVEAIDPGGFLLKPEANEFLTSKDYVMCGMTHANGIFVDKRRIPKP